MKISPRGLELIKDFEGFSSSAYLCVAKKVTIGWGNTFYEDGTKVKLGDQISKTDALKLLIKGFILSNIEIEELKNQINEKIEKYWR